MSESKSNAVDAPKPSISRSLSLPRPTRSPPGVSHIIKTRPPPHYIQMILGLQSDITVVEQVARDFGLSLFAIRNEHKKGKSSCCTLYVVYAAVVVLLAPADKKRNGRQITPVHKKRKRRSTMAGRQSRRPCSKFQMTRHQTQRQAGAERGHGSRGKTHERATKTQVRVTGRMACSRHRGTPTRPRSAMQHSDTS